MKTSNIDTEALIQGAMPKEGPRPSGARQALENKAEWQGALREQRAAPVPPELAAEAQAAETPPEPENKKPAAKPEPPAGGAQAQGPGPNEDPAAGDAEQPTRAEAVEDAAEPDPSVRGTVPEMEIPNADEPRYPGPIALAMIDQPPAPMPRTRQQQEEDVDAARQAVELASREAGDSDQLDDYFPRIKRRFGLSSLGYEGDFQRGFVVVGGINPEFKVAVTEKLTGTGIADDLQPGHITDIEFQGLELGGDQVGGKMIANPLGPDHPQGSAPSGQDLLMGMLPTDPAIYRDADKRYIRGHLLNDNIGGPGRPINLFPITAHANAVHHSYIEDSVKQWVNVKRYWVRYTVEAQCKNVIDRTPSGINYIDSVLVARASVLDTKLNPVSGLTRAVTIASTFNTRAAAEVTEEEDVAKLAAHEAREVDVAADVLLSARKGDTKTTFPPAMEAVLKERIAARGRAWVAQRLQEYPGVGGARVAALLKAYDEVKRRTDKTVTSLTPEEAPQFTYMVNAWGAGLSATL